jgi:glycosyltransferase involved in cell wall biosynthesis
VKVSVIVLSYNHEKFIRESLESILSQKTNFDFEILVGDDCSTDDSREVIKQLHKKHSKQLRLIFPPKNLGPNRNYLNCFMKSRGDYIAFCEGDDYWIDSDKLQKQVDFLDSQSDFGGVCTNNRWWLESSQTFEDSIMKQGAITFEELVEGNLINSQSSLFKKSLVGDIDWIQSLKIGDWALHLMVTMQKPYYRLADVTTVYRLHEGGIHSTLNKENKLRNKLEVLVAVLNRVSLNSPRSRLVKKAILRLYTELIGIQPRGVKELRIDYFRFGGTILNKTILKSYVKELF